MKFDYTVTTEKSFDSAVEAVQRGAVRAGFRILYVHDVQKTLGEKGFTIEPLKIIEFCNAKSAYALLQADAKIGLCMPCKINVYVKGGQTIISGMRPIVLPQFFPEAKLGDIPSEIDSLMKNVIDGVK